MSQEGIDVSSNNVVSDWAAVKAAGIQFVFVKATEGTTYTSPEYDSQRVGAHNVGLQVGSYHFARPDKGNVPESEAEHYILTAKPRDDEAICLDIEANAVNVNYWCERFVNRVKSMTGRAPYLYTFAGYLSNFAAGSTALGSCPLWLAAYQSTKPAPRAPWTSVSIWQHADNGNIHGVGGSVDLDTAYEPLHVVQHPAPPAPAPDPLEKNMSFFVKGKSTPVVYLVTGRPESIHLTPIGSEDTLSALYFGGWGHTEVPGFGDLINVANVPVKQVADSFITDLKGV